MQGNLNPSYAYSLGHKDEDGNYYGPTVPEGFQACDFPLLADGPPADGGLGNSNNHGGKGQNVLFADGNVRFVNLRTIGFQNDDIYRNKANQVAAGLDPCDPVLGSSATKPVSDLTYPVRKRIMKKEPMFRWRWWFLTDFIS